MINNYNFLKNTEELFLKSVKGKKIVLFGTSIQMIEAIRCFLRPHDLFDSICYAVDNDYRKWYSNWFGIEIREPDCLKTESEEIIVLITSQYPFRIEKQLLSYGIMDYFSFHLFLEEHIGKYQFMVTF